MDARLLRTVLGISAVSLVLGIGTTAALAAATGPLGPPFGPPPSDPVSGPLPAQPVPCTPPALPGSVVDVTFTDMGAMMGPGMMGPGMMGGGPMMGPRMMKMGMMRISASPTSVVTGQVSLRAANRGLLAHEVVVLPLAAGQYPGQRPVGTNWEVDETASLGEASQTCSAGEGDGIAPGTVGWTTMTLPPGRYELLCNIAGHYASGMYAELDVTPAR